ncbi:MAG TPA: RNA polymerase sigma factor [Allosphingosinicella sp.]
MSRPQLQPKHDDLALAKRIAARDPVALRETLQAHNRRLYRIAWAILGDRSEAEDSVQAAYLNAFRSIGSYSGEATLTTWLTRIAINEALMRRRAERRRRARLESARVAVLDDYRDPLRQRGGEEMPDAALARTQIRLMMERSIADLPGDYRSVFILREVEALSVGEVAQALGIAEGTVRSRHLRARQRLQAALAPELENALAGIFPFAGAACEALAARVIEALEGDGRDGRDGK